MTIEVHGYRAIEQLGAGGFADVFAAIRITDGLPVAIKVARRGGDPRFAREAAALRRLGAPTTPRLLAELAIDGRPALVMERVDGALLADLIDQLGPRPDPGRALAILTSVCDAVDRMHAAAITHRDLKPANIFIRPDGAATLIDFGLATPAGDAPAGAELTASAAQLGTVSYMAPEQLRGSREAGPAADRYAVGVILYQLVAGRLPFVGDRAEVERAHLSHRPPPVSAALDPLLAACLAKDPAARPAPAAAIAAAAARAWSQPAPPTPGPRGASERTVALLGITTDAAVTELQRVAQKHGGEVVAPDRRGYLLAFPGHSPARGVDAATRVAAALTARAVIHIAPLTLRTGRRRVRLSGAAIDRPDWWTPPAAGISLTTAAAATARTRTTGAAADAAPAPTRLVGRAELLDELAATGRACFADRVPTLTTITGDPGCGKSSLLAAIAAPGARVVRIDAARAGDDLCLDAAVALPATDRAPLGPLAARRVLAADYAAALRQLAAAGPAALFIDNLEQADLISLDALGLAAATDDALPLWIVAAADARLFDTRPRWARSAVRSTAHTLGAIDAADARELLAQRLPDVAYLPADLVDQLVARTGGSPRHLVDLAHALRAAGAVQRLPGRQASLVAAGELARASHTPYAERLAERVLGALAPAAREMAELCAILDGNLSEATLGAVSDGVLDPHVAIEQLAGAGLLVREATGDVRVRPALRDAIEHGLPPSRRVAAHAAALAHGRKVGWPDRDLARHAAVAGDPRLAGELGLRAAEHAARRFRYLEAQQLFSLALDHLPADHADRARARAGRADVLFLTSDHDRALDDLDHALATCSDRGDEIRWRLQRATLLDWSWRFADSAAQVARARALVGGVDRPDLAVRCLFGEGRTHWRAENYARAIPCLRDAAARARALGDRDTEVQAMVTLCSALSRDDQYERACELFDQTVALCEQLGDRLHLAAAINNRSSARQFHGDLEGALRDAELTEQLARELGYYQLQWSARCGIFEINQSLTRFADALEAAHASHRVHQTMTDAPGAYDLAMIARAHAAMGDLDDAAAWLARLSADAIDADLPDSWQPPVRAAQLAVAASFDRDAWQPVLAAARTLFVYDGYLEILYLYARAAARAGDASAVATTLAETHRAAPGDSAWTALIASL